jgi:hypothetical protein
MITHGHAWPCGALTGRRCLEPNGAPAEKLEDIARVPLPTEQFIEVISSKTPLNRDEFRALCDQQKTPEAIKAALEAR